MQRGFCAEYKMYLIGPLDLFLLFLQSEKSHYALLSCYFASYTCLVIDY